MFYLRTLDDTAWSIADVTGPIGTGTHIFEINFTANDQEFNSIRFVDGTESGQVYFDATLVNEYPHGSWVDTAYQNVKIAGGVDATNPSLLSWFRQNAKNLTPSNDDASITDALRNIADAISSGGGAGGLPSTEEASVGDVLSLDEDKKPTWAPASGGVPDPSEASVGDVLTKGEDGIEWATPSRAAGSLYVTYLTDTGSVTSSTHTCNEIRQAYLDGNSIYAVIKEKFSGYQLILPLTMYMNTDYSFDGLKFVGLFGDQLGAGSTSMYTLMHYSNDTFEFTSKLILMQ